MPLLTAWRPAHRDLRLESWTSETDQAGGWLARPSCARVRYCLPVLIAGSIMPSRSRRCCVSKARPPAHGPPLPLEDEPPSAAENATGTSNRDDDEASAPRAATGTGSQDGQAEDGWLAELRTLKPSALRRRVVVAAGFLWPKLLA